MDAGTIYSGGDFRDWTDVDVLKFPSALLYLGQRNFADGTHVVLEVVPN
jgi:hypothetical protein